MSDTKKIIETTEVTTETEEGTVKTVYPAHKKETTVTTERVIEKEEKPIIVIENS